jgi:predicted TPR repeat methyltransferase
MATCSRSFARRPMHNPTLNPVILLSPVEDGYVAYDPASDRLHELNPLAALIVELCDGTKSVEEIREIVGPLLPEEKTGEVDRWIDEGIQAGLLTWSGSSGANVRELSASELSKLAERLRDRGKVQTAFLCQQKAVELAPDDSDAWYELGELAHIVGRRGEARAAYERYLEFHPEDAEIRHILVALKDEAPPPRVPNECIQQLYQRFSSFYESNVCEELYYEGPERLQNLIKSVIGDREALAVLDLGCGTGLAGVRLKPLAAQMVGVDLSPEMIELARARNLYDRFDVAEITEWLNRSQDRFDLIVACDALIYFGDLRQVAAPAAKRLNPGGVFAFTLERDDRYPFHLTDSGRYAHHPSHVAEVAAEAGLSVARSEEGYLRMEYGVEVTGLFVALRNEG